MVILRSNPSLSSLMKYWIIVKEKPELKSDEDIKNLIKDKDQQILLARYNEDQANNQTISPDSEAQDKE